MERHICAYENDDGNKNKILLSFYQCAPVHWVCGYHFHALEKLKVKER